MPWMLSSTKESITPIAGLELQITLSGYTAKRSCESLLRIFRLPSCPYWMSQPLPPGIASTVLACTAFGGNQNSAPPPGSSNAGATTPM